jgi:O-antigen/teichoic acid export membrane protein
MTEIRNLLRHSTHYIGGRVGLTLIAFVSFPLFTRLFSVADYGLMGLVLKIVAAATVLAKMGIQNSVTRFYEEEKASPDKNALRRFYSTLFFGIGFCAVVVTVLFALGVWALPGAMIAPYLKDLLLFGAILILIRGTQTVLAGFLRVEERTKTYNVLDILAKAAGVTIVLVLYFAWKRSLHAFFSGLVVAEAAIVIAMIVALLRRHLLDPRQFDYRLLRTVVAFGFPLIWYEFTYMILDSGDRIIVNYFLGAQALGYYSAAYNISAYIQESMVAPINLALVPLYMKVWTTKGRQPTQVFLNRTLNAFLLLAVGVVCAVFTTSRDALVFLGSQKYQAAHRLLPVLVVGLVFWSLHIFFIAGLLIHKRTSTMARLNFYACAVNIGLNVILLPRIGVMGAALATLFSYMFVVILMARASFPLLPLRIDYRACARYMLVAAVTALLVSRIELDSAFWNLGCKGLLSLLMYVSVLWAVDRNVRTLISDVVGSVRSEEAPILAVEEVGVGAKN